MRFSRGFERDADLNGARMMAATGYNPIDMAKFFEKLAAQSGKGNEPKGLQLWLSSHPASGNRVQYVSEDIKYYPKRDYTTNTGQFPRIKNVVATIPPPKPKPAVLVQPKQNAQARTNLPGGLKDYQANGFAIGYPSAWQVGQGEQGGSVFIVPQGGAAKAQNGAIELIAGAMIDYYVPQGGAAGVNLDNTTREFLDMLRKGDTNLRTENSTRTDISGKPALVTRITTKTSSGVEQIGYLYTFPREAGLWYLAVAAPSNRFANEFDSVFKLMAQTVLFPN
jgi:hypothetical protein